MSLLRAITRILAMLSVTAVQYPIWFVRPRRRRAIVRRWHASMARILGMRVTIEGRVPTGPFFLVSNHVGFVDIFLLGGVMEVVFIAKSEIRGWPGMGMLASTTGTIFIDRNSRRDVLRVATVIQKSLHEGHAAILFPEGTTTAEGVQLLPFKSSLLDLAARENLSVHCAAIRYSNKRASWPGDEGFGSHFWRLLQADPFDAVVRFGGPIAGDNRKELAVRLWEEVSKLLTRPPGS